MFNIIHGIIGLGCDSMNEADQIIEEIISNIPADFHGDQLKIFTYIYVTLAYRLKYDEYASELIDMKLGGYDRERAYENVIGPASSLECLARGKAICSGYSIALETILNKLGVKTVTIKKKEVHSWNQVLIDGKWYNCDLTNDADFILDGLKCPHFLTSNVDDCNFKLRYPTTEFNECSETVSEQLQEQLIKEVLSYIKVEKEEVKSVTDDEPLFMRKVFLLLQGKGGKKI